MTGKSYTFLITLIALLLISASPAEAVNWSSPIVPIPTADEQIAEPSMAALPGGGKIAAWSQGDFSGSNLAYARTAVYISEQGAGGQAFSSSAQITAPALRRWERNPKIAAGSDGTVAIAWVRYEFLDQYNNYCGCQKSIWASVRTPGGGFSAPIEIAGSLGDAELTPEPLVAPNGDITILWGSGPGGGGKGLTIYTATRRSGGSGFSAPSSIYDVADSYAYYRAVVRQNGDLVVATYRTGDIISVQTLTRPNGENGFSAPVTLLDGKECITNCGYDDFTLTAGKDGAITAAWLNGRQYMYKAGRSFPGFVQVQASTMVPGQNSFPAPVEIFRRDLSSAGDNYYPYMKAAVGISGKTMLAWSWKDSIQASWREASSTSFSPPLTAPAGMDVPLVGSDGSPMLFYHSSGATKSIMTTSLDSGQAGFVAPTTLWESTANVFLAVAGEDGINTALWLNSNLPSASGLLTRSSDVPIFFLKVGKSGSGTVVSTPGGINCCSTCSAGFPFASTVTLTASPDKGSTFSGWSGACSGKEVTCKVVLSQARDVVATFSSGSGSGGDNSPGNNDGTNDGTSDNSVGGLKISNIKYKRLEKSILITSTVSAPEAGKIKQLATSGIKQRSIWCQASSAVKRAGDYKITCKIGSKGTRLNKKVPLKLTLRTKFTPTNGAPLNRANGLTIKKSR